MKLLELPGDIVDVIRGYIGIANNSSPTSNFKFARICTLQHNEIISLYLKLETISKLFSEWFKVNRHHQEDFWFQLLEYEAKNCNLHDLSIAKWKKQLEKTKQNIRRKVLLLRWVRTQYIANILENQLKSCKESKVSLRGVNGVGKSKICLYFEKGQFLEYYDCGIEDTTRKMINQNHIVEVDDSHVGEFSALIDSTSKNYHSTIYIFSTNHSLDNEVKDYCRRVCGSLVRVRQRYDFPILFAINKVDIPVNQRKSSIEEIQSFIESDIIQEFELRNTAIFETSAKQGINMNEIFSHIVMKMENYENFPFLAAINDIIVNDSEAINNMAAWKLESPKQKKCLLN